MLAAQIGYRGAGVVFGKDFESFFGRKIVFFPCRYIFEGK